MKKEEIKKLIKKHKYIFIGEIHGTREIPKNTLELLKEAIKNSKVIFCLELPKQAEKEMFNYLKGKINKKALFSSGYLADAVHDNRINDEITNMLEQLYILGVTFKCLENYNGNPSERDKDMALRFVNITKRYKAEKYIIYAGNMHLINKSMKIGEFLVNPIKIYLPKNIIDESLTIQFINSKGEKIEFDKKTNTVNYKIILRDIEAKMTESFIKILKEEAMIHNEK